MVVRESQQADLLSPVRTGPTPAALVYCLCGIAGIVEGFGIQAGGMAAPGFAAEFHMMPAQVGLIFLLTSFGLAAGSWVGGWLGDRIGAGRAMAAAIMLFGVADVGSAWSHSELMLAMARALVGIGLGGALPNLIKLLTVTGPPATAPRRVTLSITGIAVGSLIVGLTAFLARRLDWRIMFHLGGWIPLLLGAIVWLLLRNTSQPPQPRDGSQYRGGERWRALFGGQHLFVTLFFWLAFFVTAATSYVLINWMPSFLARSGLDQRQVGLAMIGLAVGGAAGPILFAWLLRPGRTIQVVSFAYCGIVAGLILVITAPVWPLYLAFTIGFTGFFTAGTQAVLFGIVGPFYPEAARGTGVGSSIAVGRIGSGVGPALAGLMLTAGLSQHQVLAAAVPMLAMALAMLLVLLRNPPEALQISRED